MPGNSANCLSATEAIGITRSRFGFSQIVGFILMAKNGINGRTGRDLVAEEGAILRRAALTLKGGPKMDLDV